MSVGEVVVTVQGRIGSEVEFKSAENGTGLAVFRLGSNARFYHRGENRWKDRPTTWFTVECWRTLAENANKSLRKGQPVIVTGRLKTSEWTGGEGETRSKTVLDAYTIGHDLARGTAEFTKNPPQQQDQAAESASDEMRQLVEHVESSAVDDLSSLDEDGETAPYVVTPGDRKAA